MSRLHTGRYDRRRRAVKRNPGGKRYAMWGLPKGETETWKEVLLLSDASAADVAKVKPLATRDGWHRLRVAELTDAPPDFASTVRGARRKNPPTVIRSERDAWEHMTKIGNRLVDRDNTVHHARSAGVVIKHVAAEMLHQLGEGIHMNRKARRKAKRNTSPMKGRAKNPPRRKPMPFVYVIDLDERGEFRAHVQSKQSYEKGIGSDMAIWQTESDPETGEVPEIVDGFMRHGRDVRGLTDYLASLGILIPGDSIDGPK